MAGKYDFNITAKKFAYGLAYALLTAGIAYSIDFLKVAEFPPEYAVWAGCIIAVLQAIQNWLKHRND